MELARWGRAEIRCSPLFLLLIPAAVLLGRAETLLILLSSLFVHEFSHVFMAHRLGFSLRKVDMQPFGFIAELSREPTTPGECAAVAAAGPVASLLLGLCASGLASSSLRWLNAGFFRELSAFNLALGAVNLLPVLPLDGGRLVFALVSLKSGGKRAASHTVLSVLGAAAGLLIAACGIFLFLKRPDLKSVSMMLSGAFIAIAAAAEAKNAAFMAKAGVMSAVKLYSGGSLRVVPAAMHMSCTVRDALRAVAGGGYGLVLVTDDRMRTVAAVDEGRLVAAAAEGGTELPLSVFIRRGSNAVEKHPEPRGDHDGQDR